MELLIKSTNFPFQLKISGNISRIDYEWKIRPFLDEINSLTLDEVMIYLRSIKDWAIDRGNEFKLRANFLFKVLFYLFQNK